MLAATHSNLGSAVSAQRVVGRLVLTPAAAAIALLTLIPSPTSGGSAQTPFWCLLCGDFGSVDATLNTLLFIPFGLALGLMGFPWRRIVLAALLTTTCIEALQLTIVPGRDASISDVLTNTTGGVIGASLALNWRRLVLPHRSAARVLGALLALSWTATRTGTAWLVRPSFPETVWFAQLAPRDVYPADFRGEVLRADIGGVTPRAGRMPELRTALLPASVEVHAQVSGAGNTIQLASVISVVDEHRSEILVLGQEGRAARFRVRLRAADALFRTPSVSLDNAFPLDPRGPIELAGFRSPGRLSLSSAIQGRISETTIALGPGLGWALLLPFDTGLTPAAAAAGTAALTAAVLLLVGYYAGMGLPRPPLAAASAALMLGAVGLWSPSIVFPEATVTSSEVLAGILGSTLGVLAGYRVGMLVTGVERR